MQFITMSGSSPDDAITTTFRAAPMRLDARHVYLRPFRSDDATEVCRYAGDYGVARMAGIPYPYEDSMAADWIASHAGLRKRGERLVWAIDLLEASTLVGSVSLRLEPDSEAAALGYWVGRPFWGRGYATEAVNVVIRCAFEDIGLHRVFARHITSNPASGRVMVKAGMRYEATLRNLLRQGDQWVDFAYYSLLASEYRGQKAHGNDRT